MGLIHCDSAVEAGIRDRVSISHRVIFGVAAAVSIASTTLIVYRASAQTARPEATPPVRVAPRGAEQIPPARSVQDVLLLPYTFTLHEETTLDAVCKRLRETLGIRVVLDRAALARKQIKDSTTVRLELDGVRLKTGLKLLLDQVELTYKVVAEDNLLILTDAQGADDPIERIARDLKAMHLEIHDLQDAVDDLRAQFEAVPGDAEPNPKMRNPTIIEEVPPAGEAGKGAKPKGKGRDEGSSAKSRPGF